MTAASDAAVATNTRLKRKQRTSQQVLRWPSQNCRWGLAHPHSTSDAWCDDNIKPSSHHGDHRGDAVCSCQLSVSGGRFGRRRRLLLLLLMLLTRSSFLVCGGRGPWVSTGGLDALTWCGRHHRASSSHPWVFDDHTATYDRLLYWLSASVCVCVQTPDGSVNGLC